MWDDGTLHFAELRVNRTRVLGGLGHKRSTYFVTFDTPQSGVLIVLETTRARGEWPEASFCDGMGAVSNRFQAP